MRLRWLTQANQGPAAARNAGVRTAVGEYIVFVDDDVVPEPQLLEEHARSHRRRAGGCGARAAAHTGGVRDGSLVAGSRRC